MGIDIHAFNFIKLQADNRPLGSILTIGRQALDVPEDYIKKRLGVAVDNIDGYCESLLIALNANDITSVDCSDYEGATHVGDLNGTVDLGREFDTVIDSGSLEHIFDTASAFNNLINFCKVGGRIIHILPVNNLSGHGFWQFSSDLIYSIYSERNGFHKTQVYYASGLDFNQWYKIPEAKHGCRVELASLEPIILLSVAEKFENKNELIAMQPFYLEIWEEKDESNIKSKPSFNKAGGVVEILFKNRGWLFNAVRNFFLIFGLATGYSRFSIKNTRFERVQVDQVLGGFSK